MAIANVAYFLISPRKQLVDAVGSSSARFRDFALRRRLWEGYQIDAIGRNPQEFDQKVVKAFIFWFEKSARNEPEFTQVFKGGLRASDFGLWWDIEALQVEHWLTEVEREMEMDRVK